MDARHLVGNDVSDVMDIRAMPGQRRRHAPASGSLRAVG
jgi:hypothetical protein